VSVRVVATLLTVSVSDLEPLEGSAVTFSAALADASATPTFAWDFGDGTTSTEPAPRHTFPDDGFHIVRVSATDADGTHQASVLVIVSNAPPVVETLSIPDAVSEAQEVELSALAVDPAGSADTLEYSWNFGDGSPPARGPRVRHAFRDDGASTCRAVAPERLGRMRWCTARGLATVLTPRGGAGTAHFSNAASAGQTCSLSLGCAAATGWMLSGWKEARSMAMGSSRNGSRDTWCVSATVRKLAAKPSV